MKRRRPLPWKRLLFGFLSVFLLVQFYMEYFWIAVFCSIVPVIVLLRMGYEFWKGRRKARRIEGEQEGAVSCLQERRRQICRETRYGPEEQEAVEAYIRNTLGPISRRFPRTEEERLPNVEIVLVAPAGDVSCWRAVTIGAGAWSLNYGRAELGMLLPPDWDPNREDWPLRILREAIQTFMIYQGGFGPGFSCRGFHMMSAGFAGAVVADALPAPTQLALPNGDSVRLHWLMPLLKPEWDYFKARDLLALWRRIRKSDLAADPGRKPCVGWNWFQEDIAPFACSENEGRWCLGLDTGEFCQEMFLRAGLGGTGWDWERLAREYLRKYQPNDGPFVEYACEERVFFAASEDGEIMRRMALGLSDLLRYEPDRMLALLVPEEHVRREEQI